MSRVKRIIQNSTYFQVLHRVKLTSFWWLEIDQFMKYPEIVRNGYTEEGIAAQSMLRYGTDIRYFGKFVAIELYALTSTTLRLILKEWLTIIVDIHFNGTHLTQQSVKHNFSEKRGSRESSVCHVTSGKTFRKCDFPKLSRHYRLSVPFLIGIRAIFVRHH